MFYTRYEGSFLSHKGVAYKARILQEASQAFATIGELEFPAASPLTIEWDETGKEVPVCGSVATLTVISPGDRTYEDLYSIKPGQIRLDVFKDNVLYWSGCLDPEFYEEPYSSGAGYEVSLTFSDFGILHRLPYEFSGMKTLEEILLAVLVRSKINYSQVDTSLVSTGFDSTAAIELEDISVRSDNFYDEDGVAMNLHDVLSGILQPLAMKVIQRSGIIYVYDINGLFHSQGYHRIVWALEDQRMSTDRVINNAKVTLSTYGGDSIAEEIKYEGVVDETLINLTNDAVTPERYSYYQNYEEGHMGADWDYDWLSFTIFLSNQGKGLASKLDSARYFHICPLLGGDESEGIAYWFYTGGHGPLTSGFPRRKCAQTAASASAALMTTHKVYLPTIPVANVNDYNLRLTLPMLLDPRYNPFSDSETGNEKEHYSIFRTGANYVFVPVKIQVYDDSGNVVCHYDNRGENEYKIGWETVNGKATRYSTKGKWMEGPAAYDDCMLSWYDPDDIKDGCGILGWKNNRQTAGLFPLEFYPSLAAQPDGQVIPYPPQGGYIEVQVCAGIKIYDKFIVPQAPVDETDALLPGVRWFLFKTPKLELVKAAASELVVGSEDVEYTGVLNADAQDDIEIDTICGTTETPAPLSRGLYFKTSSKTPITEFTRNGRTSQVEQLLIGTLYSQFAGRKTKLSGTAFIVSGSLEKLRDDAQGTKDFMLIGDSQDLIEDESSITVVEIAEDEYISNED